VTGSPRPTPAFRKDASPQEMEKLAQEWRRLSVNTAGCTGADIGSRLTKGLGGAWMPESKQELARLFQVIRAAAASGEHP
jgi:hypothetical protein